jgi:protein-S-isoprenylcysteine O-methyltransferase Ste14
MKLLLVIMLSTHFIFTSDKLIVPPISYLGLVFAGLGVMIMMTAHNRFMRVGTAIRPDDNPSLLVCDGIFQFTRNPMYLGFILILSGVAIFLGTLLAFFAPVAMFFILDRTFIPHEEQLLMSLFAEEYMDYKITVRRWI